MLLPGKKDVAPPPQQQQQQHDEAERNVFLARCPRLRPPPPRLGRRLLRRTLVQHPRSLVLLLAFVGILLLVHHRRRRRRRFPQGREDQVRIQQATVHFVCQIPVGKTQHQERASVMDGLTEEASNAQTFFVEPPKPRHTSGFFLSKSHLWLGDILLFRRKEYAGSRKVSSPTSRTLYGAGSVWSGDLMPPSSSSSFVSCVNPAILAS